MREDEGLRFLAITKLAELGPGLAREALEAGEVEVQENVLAWSGSYGMVHGHLVVLWLDADTCQRVNESPSVIDALTHAFAAAVSQVSGNALAELKVLARAMIARRSTAYRGRL
jgi:hypothetical protein